jgi:hypothetical protein
MVPVVKNNLHSSSDVQRSCVGHTLIYMAIKLCMYKNMYVCMLPFCEKNHMKKGSPGNFP